MTGQIRFLFLLLTWMIFFPDPGSAQVSIGKFISSASADFEVKTFEAQSLYLEKKPYRLSPLKELEYRHTNYELLDVHNRMGLRLTPANPWELKANNRYYQDYQGTLLLQRELAFREALTERYQAVVDYMYYLESRNLQASRSKILAEQLGILQKQSGSGLFDADEFARLKVDELDFEIDLIATDVELAHQVHVMEALFPTLHGSPLTWTTSELITVNQIKAVMDSMVTASVKSTLLAYEQQKIRTAQSHYKTEKYNWNIGFVQGTYDQWRNEQGDVPLILSFGLSIPVTNPNKPDMARRKLQQIEAEYDLEESSNETARDKIIMQDRLANMLTRYNDLERRIGELKSGELAQSLSRIKGGDPFVFVQVLQRVSRLEMLLLKIKRDIFTTYVGYLTFTDRIQRPPLTNYLLPQLPPIED